MTLHIESAGTRDLPTQVAQMHIASLVVADRVTNWVPDGLQANIAQASGWGLPNRQASAAGAVAQYTQWYRRFVEQYAGDLAKAGLKKPQRLKYGRESGILDLYWLTQRIQAVDKSQMQAVTSVLEGFQELASVSTGLAERGVLVVVLVKDVIKQLRELGLLRPDRQFINSPAVTSQLAA